MNIPDEIYHRAYEAGEFQMADYKVIAEWARKEALREAADKVSRLYAGTDTDDQGRAWIAGVDASARAIRALAEGVSDAPAWKDPEPWHYPVSGIRTAHKLAQTTAEYRPRTEEQFEEERVSDGQQ